MLSVERSGTTLKSPLLAETRANIFTVAPKRTRLAPTGAQSFPLR